MVEILVAVIAGLCFLIGVSFYHFTKQRTINRLAIASCGFLILFSLSLMFDPVRAFVTKKGAAVILSIFAGLGLVCTVVSLLRWMYWSGTRDELKFQVSPVPSPGSTNNATQTEPSRALKVVVLDDNAGPRQVYSMLLRGWYENIEIRSFEDARAAWQELSLSDPDLFITDIHHEWISCEEMLGGLAERNARYPILVISAGIDLYGSEVLNGWGKGLNLSFVSKPMPIEEFRAAVEAALKLPANPTYER